MLLTSIGTLLGNTANAGVTAGFGVGPLLNVPQSVYFDGEDDCQMPIPVGFTVETVNKSPSEWSDPSARPCAPRTRFGGQVSVPIRIGLGERAALRIPVGLQVIGYNGVISWDDDVYSGQSAFLFRPQVGLGAEYAFSGSGITPYVAGDATFGFNVDVQSLGPNRDGDHIETTLAYEMRDAEHCNGVSQECPWDAVNTSVGFGAQLAVGARTADAGKLGFFGELSYNLTGLRGARVPDDYPSTVELGSVNLHSFGLTAGLLIPL